MNTLLSTHQEQPWLAHQILNDFRIEDVWLLPIELTDKNTIQEVQDNFVAAIGQIDKKGFAGLLFQFRNWLGKIFHWEGETPSREMALTGILKRRYAEKVGTPVEKLPKGGFQHFDQVYQLDSESLLEIENKTVQAAIHFGKVSIHHKTNAQMTIYVKPKGWFGQLYMLTIKPFRHWIVYPTLLKAVARQWKHKYA